LKALRILLLIPLCLLIQSCSIQSSQLSFLMSSLEVFSSDRLEKSSWSLRYGNYYSKVFPIKTDAGVLFSNQAGDEILFDGWTISSISGLGINRANWKVIDNNNRRSYLRGNSIVGEHSCDLWITSSNSKASRFTQECSSFVPFENSILVDSEGYVSSIRQNVDGSSKFLILTRNTH
jgi:hypothetical protein